MEKESAIAEVRKRAGEKIKAIDARRLDTETALKAFYEEQEAEWVRLLQERADEVAGGSRQTRICSIKDEYFIMIEARSDKSASVGP